MHQTLPRMDRAVNFRLWIKQTKFYEICFICHVILKGSAPEDRSSYRNSLRDSHRARASP